MKVLYGFSFQAKKPIQASSEDSSTETKPTTPSPASLSHHPNLNQCFMKRAISTLLSLPQSLPTLQSLHAHLLKSNPLIADRIVFHYLEFSRFSDARNLFDEIPLKDLPSWNNAISSFSRKGCVGVCLDLMRRVRDEAGLEPNDVTIVSVIGCCGNAGAVEAGRFVHGVVVKFGWFGVVRVGNALIVMYGRFGDVTGAVRVMKSMKTKNVVSWNSILIMYVRNGMSGDVMRVFGGMREAGVRPDQATMVSVCQGVIEMGIAKQVEMVHGCVLKSGFRADVLVMTSVLTAYARSGRLDEGKEVFAEMSVRDSVAWTAMLAAYAVHGRGKEAIQLFELMVKDGVRADHVTFTHLLSACSHSGLIDAGQGYFNNMSIIYGVEPRMDHYSCMVDLLGRSGDVEGAYRLIKTMPMEPNAGVWGALLAACRIHKNTELGKVAAENLFALDSSDHRNYVMLSNIYSASGQWTDASRTRSLMKIKGLTTNPGWSLIEHGNTVHRFLVGDQSHPESPRIYTKLEEMMGKLKEAGFVRRTEFVLHDVAEDVKEDMINKHSEKLAIAFGLLVTSPSMPITIIKNLRICGDCHMMAKLVSLAESRKIIIRDTKRFHHFADGVCSCGDYW